MDGATEPAGPPLASPRSPVTEAWTAARAQAARVAGSIVRRLPPSSAPPRAEGEGRSWWASRSAASRWYLLPMLGVVAAVVALVAYEYAQAPLPPGVDPGHWLSASYAYVGMPSAPDPANRPFVYSPLLFPFLGGLVALTHDPPLAATILALLLLAGYGLSVIHLGRRFLLGGNLQVLFAGLAVCCGVTLQMLFWGAYPNLLGFILFNEAMLFFLLYVRTRTSRDGAAFFVLTGLTYLAHDLSFALLIGAVAVSAFFLLLFGRLSYRFLFEGRNLAGLAGLGALIGAYGAITSRLGIPHPSYFYSNPSAFTIDEIGEIFVPMGHYPAYFPPGTTVVLAPFEAVAVLLGSALALLLVFVLLHRHAPAWLDTRLLVAGGWMCAAASVPAVGYLAHVDTDYQRFLYFLPLPFTLLALVGLERALLAGGTPPEASPEPARSGSTFGRVRARRRFGSPSGLVGALFLVALLFASVTVPLAAYGERSGAAAGHDAYFLDAVQWLNHNASPGNVLTDAQAARWTEALTNRQAYTEGPVWLLFDPFQIYQSEASYWALNSEYVVSNGQVVLSYSGFASEVFSQAPLYSPYVDGVAFPVFRVLPGAIVLNGTGPGGTSESAVLGSTTPSAVLSANGSGSSTITYQSALGTLTEVGTPGSGGAGVISFTVAPAAGTSIRSLSLTLTAPPGTAPMLARDSITELASAGASLFWDVSGTLGQYPYPDTVPTTVNFSEAPSASQVGKFLGVKGWKATFPDPNGSGPFRLGMVASTSGTSNPTSKFSGLLTTAEFLGNRSIHFLLWPAGSFYADQRAYFAQQLGFQPVYTNSEWVVMED